MTQPSSGFRHRGRGRPKKKPDERKRSVKDANRRFDIDPRCYVDNSLSLGGKVKGECAVLSTRLFGDRRNVKLNINCRIEGLGKLLEKFDETKLEWVKQMGMYPLVHICQVGCLPAQLCYWLATRVDVVNKALYTLDGVRFSLSSVQVHWILGIPMGRLKVPGKGCSNAAKEEAKKIQEKYSTRSGTTNGIFLSTLVEVLERDTLDEFEFKRVFLMFLLGQVLCPTTSYRISVSLLPAVTVALDAKDYDWCSLVLEYLYYAIRNFGKRFYPDGFSAGCGGCMIFLAIFYLDRLRRTPLDWGVWPRIVVWSQAEINKAQDEDSVVGGDFGFLGCVDVAYLEKHPLAARDGMPHGSGGCHDCALSGCVPFRGRVRRVARRRERSPPSKRPRIGEEFDAADVGDSDSPPPGFERVLDEVVRATVGEVECNASVIGTNSCGVDLNLSSCTNPRYEWASGPSGHLCDVEARTEDDETLQEDMSDGSPIYESVGEDQVVAGENDGCDGQVEDQIGISLSPSAAKEGHEVGGNCGKFSHTRKQRKIKPSAALSGMYVQQWQPRGFGRYQSKLARFALISFQLLGGRDVILLKCGEHAASASECSTLLSDDGTGLLSANYVRAALAVNHRMWDDFFVGRSRRIMLDPAFASNVLNTSVGTLSDIPDAINYASRLVDISVEKFNWVFVPVMNRSQWWCAVFSFSNGDVGVLDPLDPGSAASNHHEEVLKLKNGIDELLKLCQPTWNVCCHPFASYSVPVNHVVADALSLRVNSGLEMLIGIKRIACRLEFCCAKGPKAGETLLAEHVLSQFNEEKNNVIEMLKKYMD